MRAIFATVGAVLMLGALVALAQVVARPAVITGLVVKETYNTNSDGGLGGYDPTQDRVVASWTNTDGLTPAMARYLGPPAPPLPARSDEVPSPAEYWRVTCPECGAQFTTGAVWDHVGRDGGREVHSHRAYCGRCRTKFYWPVSAEIVKP
jgi:hypothetical protein